MRKAWCRTACLWLAGVGISVASLLHPILNNPQTEDLGKGPVDDDFYPPSSFYRDTAKVDDPSGQLRLGVQKDCQQTGRIRYP